MRNTAITILASLLAICLLYAGTQAASTLGRQGQPSIDRQLPAVVTATITTDASGDADEDTVIVSGIIESIVYDGGLDAGAAIVITGATSGAAILSDTPGAAATWRPMAQAHDTSGDAITNGYVPIVLVQEPINIVVSSGGNVDTGVFTITVR